ncbi:hypothetical protein DN069_34940 [Streptacidiphilus pinicola]|uniref:Uncharacterized protein n=1 Tax=Streptacidiphilus pinicola TaxID=2219663 RepID=A0A2X0ICF1_9ACTN|nr:hypothetical protein [Streptacidiphilus pinicola]RAG81051.1 hypothetical protein DN069_34940 [Streptacidiphilus pinicola]
MRCGICGSEKLGPLGELETDSRLGELRSPRLRFPRLGIFKARPDYIASYGRACLDCGALFPFLGPAELRRLNADAAADRLQAVTPADYDY